MVNKVLLQELSWIEWVCFALLDIFNLSQVLTAGAKHTLQNAFCNEITDFGTDVDLPLVNPLLRSRLSHGNNGLHHGL